MTTIHNIAELTPKQVIDLGMNFNDYEVYDQDFDGMKVYNIDMIQTRLTKQWKTTNQLEEVFDALKELNTGTEQTWVSHEFDKIQSEYEAKSTDFKLGVQATNEKTAKVLLMFLCAIVDEWDFSRYEEATVNEWNSRIKQVEEESDAETESEAESDEE